MNTPWFSSMERLKNRIIARARGNLYTVAIVTALTLILSNQLLIQYMLYQKRADAHVINIAASQRTLSQMILAQFCQSARNPAQRAQLEATLAEWTKVQDGLIFGDEALGLPPCNAPHTRKKLLQAQTYIYSSEIKLNVLASNANLDLVRLTANQTAFMTAMDRILNDLEDEAERKLLTIVWVEAILALFSLLVLVVEYLLIFKPTFAELFRQKKLLVQENQAVKATQQRLTAILNSTTDLNLLIGPDHTILSVNKAAQEFAHKVYGKGYDITDRFMENLDGNQQAEFAANFARALSGETVSLTKKIDFGNQIQVWFALQYFPAYNEAGQLIGVSLNAKNINKEQERYEKLLAINWTHSHEIRRPLANMMGLMELVDWNQITNENKEIFDHFVTSINELDDIIHKVTHETEEGKGII
jgi:PAS domain-containing protein